MQAVCVTKRRGLIGVRQTLDVDITLSMPPEDPEGVIDLLGEIGRAVDAEKARGTLVEHGFCAASLAGLRVDVFLPIVEFYTVVRVRPRQVDLGGAPLMIWNTETLVIFTRMFFRDEDLVDIAQILRTQGERFDREWITVRLVDLFGRREPRIGRWHELLAAADASSPSA